MVTAEQLKRIAVWSHGLTEREAEVEVLTELGCDCVQGFVFARPVPPEAAPAIARAIEASVEAPSLVPGDQDGDFDTAPIGL